MRRCLKDMSIIYLGSRDGVRRRVGGTVSQWPGNDEHNRRGDG